MICVFGEAGRVDRTQRRAGRGVAKGTPGEDRPPGSTSRSKNLTGPRWSLNWSPRDIAEQLIKRAGFRRTMKRAMEQTMEAGAKGIKIQLSGRLGGAEMSRREKQISGSIPLSTLRANIDYGFTQAKIAQGHLGVQVWINLGTYSEGDSDGADAQTSQAPKKPKRTYKR